MAFGYPVLLELAGRRAVVVGAFAVEAGKVEGLLVAGAEVIVFAKGPEEVLARLEQDPRVTVHRRGYRGPGDLAGAVLCVASDPEPGVRDTIAADARAAGVLVNVMDDVSNCDFAAPAIVRRGDLVIAIGTGGRAPALASRLRAELSERFGPEWAELLEVVGKVRTATLPHLPDFDDRSRRWKAALDLDELEQLIRAGLPDEAATRLRNRLLAGLPGARTVLPGTQIGLSGAQIGLSGAQIGLSGACGQPGDSTPALGHPPVQGPHHSEGLGDARPTGSREGRPTGSREGRPTGSGETRPAGSGDARPAGSGDTGPAGSGDAGPAGSGDTRPAGSGDPGPAGSGETRPAGSGETHPAGSGDARPAGSDAAHLAGSGEGRPAGSSEARPADAGEARP